MPVPNVCACVHAHCVYSCVHVQYVCVCVYAPLPLYWYVGGNDPLTSQLVSQDGGLSVVGFLKASL